MVLFSFLFPQTDYSFLKAKAYWFSQPKNLKKSSRFPLNRLKSSIEDVGFSFKASFILSIFSDFDIIVKKQKEKRKENM